MSKQPVPLIHGNVEETKHSFQYIRGVILPFFDFCKENTRIRASFKGKESFFSKSGNEENLEGVGESPLPIDATSNNTQGQPIIANDDETKKKDSTGEMIFDWSRVYYHVVNYDLYGLRSWFSALNKNRCEPRLVSLGQLSLTS